MFVCFLLFYIISYYIKLCHMILYYVILYHIFYVVLHYIKNYILLYYILIYYILIDIYIYTVLYNVILHFTILYYVILDYVISYSIIIIHICGICVFHAISQFLHPSGRASSCLDPSRDQEHVISSASMVSFLGKPSGVSMVVFSRTQIYSNGNIAGMRFSGSFLRS